MSKRGFTLAELLIVIGVISILSVLTLVSIRAITRDARVASGVNAMSAVLDSARSLAIKRNEPALVVFRPRLDETDLDEDGWPEGRVQVVEAITMVWSGESYSNTSKTVVMDRFVPSPDVPIRVLPKGVKVAGPAYSDSLYGDEEDFTWVTQTHFPERHPVWGSNEVPGVALGVMYGPDGATMSQNPDSDSDFIWADFDPRNYPDTGFPEIRQGGVPKLPDPDNVGPFVDMSHPDDESFVTVVPFLAVYDDELARDSKTGDWSLQADYLAELTGPNGFITINADRLHFNRFTGVVMR